MARFSRQVGACTGGQKGAGLSIAKPTHVGRVTSDRADGQSEQSHARYVLTKRPKHPGCPAAGSLRGGLERRQPWPTQAWWSRSPDRRRTWAAVTWGARATHRGGEHGTTGSAPSASSGLVPFTRRCSAHAARRSNSSSSLPPPRRPPSSAPSSPRKRRRPRKGYAERVDRRHGSLASSHEPA